MNNNTRDSYKGNYNKYSQSSETRNSYPGFRSEGGSTRDVPSGSYNKVQQDLGRISNNRNQYQTETDTRNKHYDASHSKHNRAQDTNRKEFSADKNERSSRNQMSKYPAVDDSHANYNKTQKNGDFYNNESNQSTASAPWVWKVGDKCMAKYWEDNRVFKKFHLNLRYSGNISLIIICYLIY